LFLLTREKFPLGPARFLGVGLRSIPYLWFGVFDWACFLSLRQHLSFLLTFRFGSPSLTTVTSVFVWFSAFLSDFGRSDYFSSDPSSSRPLGFLVISGVSLDEIPLSSLSGNKIEMMSYIPVASSSCLLTFRAGMFVFPLPLVRWRKFEHHFVRHQCPAQGCLFSAYYCARSDRFLPLAVFDPSCLADGF